MPNPLNMVAMADDFTGSNGSPNSIRDVWGGTNSLPETIGQRQAPANFLGNASSAATIAAEANAGGAEQVGNRMGLVDGAVVSVATPRRTVNGWVEVDRWMEGRAITGNVGSVGNMRMSPQGRAMLKGFEMQPDYARLRGIGRFDEQGNLTAIYPHYVMRNNVDTRALESDGGITLGFGVLIRHDEIRASRLELLDRFAPNAPRLPVRTDATHRVPGSLPITIEDANILFDVVLPEFEDAVNSFLLEHGTVVEQHQFDVLVSFTYQMGPNTWTLPGRQGWNINQLLRGGPPFDPDRVYVAFNGFRQSQDRRRREGEIFINGH